MQSGAPRSFGAQLKSLREAAGFTQEELATIAGLSVHAVSALERGQRRRPHVDTVRALAAALDLTGVTREALFGSARAPAPTAAADELRDGALPLAPTIFLGRESDVHTLRLWLLDPTARLITLTGPGGAGKTRLALELARAIAAEGGLRVVFVPLAAIRDATLVAPSIAEALGLSDVTAADLPRLARGACEDQPTLVVLDNLEQILDAAPLIADLLTSVATLRVLATSRAPLRLRGEREYSVGPLPLASDLDARSPADLARCAAVRLFIERVRDVRPDFRLTPANGPTVAAICRRLDALPLALELAAPWLKVLTPEDLLGRLTDDVLLSSAGPRDLPERQRTMNATVAWSYQLLTPDEQRVFRRLGALPERFSIEAAAAVVAGQEERSTSSDALEVVAALIDKSLLLRVETAVTTRPLYQMLETVRAFAALELTAAGEEDDALAGLARYCVGEAALAAEGLVGRAQVEWLDRVRHDLENFRSALAWLLDRGLAAEASDIAGGLMFFWLIRGHAAEGLRWYERTLNLPSIPPAAESRSLLGAAVMSFTQGELERARAGLTGVLALAPEVDDVQMVATAEMMLGHIELAGRHVEAARDRFAHSYERFTALAIPWGAGHALTGMAWVVLATGDVGQAERLLDEATTLVGRAGPWFESLNIQRRANLAVRRGNPDQAISLVRESLTRVRALHDKYAFVYALIPLTAAAILKGDDAWAAEILGVRDAVTDRTGVTVVDEAAHDFREQAERDLRARLGPERWDRAHAAGRRSSIDGLLRDIDRVLGQSRQV